MKRKKKIEGFSFVVLAVPESMARLHDEKGLHTLAWHPLVESPPAKEETKSLVRNLGSFSCQHQPARIQDVGIHRILRSPESSSPPDVAVELHWANYNVAFFSKFSTSSPGPGCGGAGYKGARVAFEFARSLFPHLLGPFRHARIHHRSEPPWKKWKRWNGMAPHLA